MKYYFVIIGEEQLGPLTISELAQMGLTRETPVWNEGLPDWTVAGALPELAGIVGAGTNPVSGAVPPQYSGTVGHYSQSTQSAESAESSRSSQGSDAGQSSQVGQWSEGGTAKHRRSYVGWLIAALIATILVIALAVTCPTRADHQRAIAGVTKEWMGDKLDQWGADGMLGSLFRMVGGVSTDMVVDNMLDVNDYFLWSVGYIEVGSNRYRASIGIMGHVFTFNKEHIDQAVNEWIGITKGEMQEQPQIAPPAPEENAGEALASGEGAAVDSVPVEAGGGVLDSFVDTMTNKLKDEGKELLKRWIDSL